ncbi:MAG TPA: energy transducer TonB [Chitinophagales bacterium]|nr:energy transducer TonB [Chitinophagales bacterium]
MKSLVFLFLLFSLGMSQFSYSQETLDTNDKILEFFEISQQPRFPGGNDSMSAFISRNLKYPQEAMDNGIEGMVTVQFVVDKDGAITNIKIIKNPGGGLGAEAERVLRLMPKWNPGYQKEVPVRVKMVIPLRFKLNKGQEELKVSTSEQDPNVEVYVIDDLEIQPEFPGGANEMSRFIAKNIRYTEAALDNGIQGNVILSVILDRDGSVSNVHIVQNPGYGLGEEAERMVRLMPKWSPGYIKGGTPVRTKLEIPVRFKLNR